MARFIKHLNGRTAAEVRASARIFMSASGEQKQKQGGGGGDDSSAGQDAGSKKAAKRVRRSKRIWTA